MKSSDTSVDTANRSFLFFFLSFGHHRNLHSFPTRRSSDLVAIGEVNGTSDRVTASRDSGFASVANEPKNAIMIKTVTGTWLCRASCSVEQVAATAANIAEYRKKPPRKNAMNTSAVAPDTCGTWKTCPTSGAAPPMRLTSAARWLSNSLPDAPQIAN